MAERIDGELSQQLLGGGPTLGMEPGRFDALVTKVLDRQKVDSFLTELWWRLGRVNWQNLPPLARAAVAVARARICVLTSQEAARAWLADAQSLADPTGLDDVFDMTGLQAQINRPPQVVDGRFTPDTCSVSAFAKQCWVVCPKCGGPGG